MPRMNCPPIERASRLTKFTSSYVSIGLVQGKVRFQHGEKPTGMGSCYSTPLLPHPLLSENSAREPI